VPGSEPRLSYEEKKRADADARRRQRAADERSQRISNLETRIAEREQEIKALERQMAAPGFYDQRDAAHLVVTAPAIDVEVGDLMNEWESMHRRRRNSASWRPPCEKCRRRTGAACCGTGHLR
jgi:hypothetical protein